MKSYLCTFLLFGTLISSVLFAHANVPTNNLAAPAQVMSVLPDNIRQKITALNFSEKDVSIWVAPLDGRPPVISHYADTLRTPASTQKLITTLIALDTLGENYHWYTHIYQKGVVVKGVLYGDIVIKGFGDPSLTHERLKVLFEHLYAKGIRHIQGNIIVDNGAFKDVATDVNAFDGHGIRAYNAQPNALLINFGTLELDILPSGTLQDTKQMDKTGRVVQVFVPSGGNMASLQVLPPLFEFAAPSSISAVNDGSCNSEPQIQLTSSQLAVSGVVKSACGRMTRWLTFADSDVFIQKAIKGTWQKFDPKFTGQVKLTNHATQLGLPIVSYPSRPLANQIYDINQYSNNVMTEQVALTLPLSVGDKVSTYPKTFALMNGWWKSHLKSSPPVMSRASGLCRDCRIAPSAMGELLAYAYHQPYFQTFKTSLPIAGRTGTMLRLAYRNPQHPAIERAFIKTGTLDNVSSMAGYVIDSQNRWYVVVGMVNAPNASGRGAVSILDEMLATVARY